MKFDIKEYVYVTPIKKNGEIKQYKHEVYLNKAGERVEKCSYFIKTSPYTMNWYEESELTYVEEFDNRFELGLIDLLIDVNLLMHNFELVEKLRLEKIKRKGMS